MPKFVIERQYLVPMYSSSGRDDTRRIMLRLQKRLVTARRTAW
jgi:hypothetical protein